MTVCIHEHVQDVQLLLSQLLHALIFVPLVVILNNNNICSAVLNQCLAVHAAYIAAHKHPLIMHSVL